MTDPLPPTRDRLRQGIYFSCSIHLVVVSDLEWRHEHRQCRRIIGEEAGHEGQTDHNDHARHKVNLHLGFATR